MCFDVIFKILNIEYDVGRQSWTDGGVDCLIAANTTLSCHRNHAHDERVGFDCRPKLSVCLA